MWKKDIHLSFIISIYINQICPNALDFSKSSVSKIKSNMYFTFKSRDRGRKGMCGCGA